ALRYSARPASITLAGRRRHRLQSLQFPFQPLQCCINFIGPNRSLTLITMASVHENSDVVHPFLHKGEVFSQLASLFGCERVVN
ncbi:MAG: hypothetical protein JWO48_1452, partial [Bryobacterales bacterium]|nr:hypothetical protein [Bryobacterales bacterium]